MKRVLFFGSSGVGKSSLANLTFGTNFKCGNGRVGCTFETQIQRSADGRCEIIDTAGLGENKLLNRVNPVTALCNLARLRENCRSGIDAIVMVKARGAISETEMLNAKIIHGILFDGKPNLLCAVTGFDAWSVTDIEGWQRDALPTYVKVVNAVEVICGSSKDPKGVDNPFLKGYYEVETERFSSSLARAINSRFYLDQPYLGGTGLSLWESFRCYYSGLGFPLTDLSADLAKQGLPEDVTKVVMKAIAEEKLSSEYPKLKYSLDTAIGLIMK